jgi:hypothetical protein
MKQNLQYRDPVTLSVHPAIKHIPALAEDDLKPIRAGMKYAGESLAPIPIDDEGRILSDTGRTAWLCAKARQLKEVPVVINPSAEVHWISIRDLAHRRHLSKSAIAYLAVPHLQPALEAARMRKLENLRKSPENLEGSSGAFEAQTVAELAEELGLGEETLKRAIEVRKIFEDKKVYTFYAPGCPDDGVETTAKEFYEPRLLRAFVGGEHEHNRPIGLGGIIAGFATVKEGDKSKFAPKPRQTDFFGDLFSDQVGKFIALPEIKRTAALAVIRKSAEEMEPAECEQAAATLRSMAKIYADAAKSKPITD